jgi:hypothetical protein
VHDYYIIRFVTCQYFFVVGFTETMAEDGRSKEELEPGTDEGGELDEPDPLLDEILLDVDNLVQERTSTVLGLPYSCRLGVHLI